MHSPLFFNVVRSYLCIRFSSRFKIQIGYSTYNKHWSKMGFNLFSYISYQKSKQVGNKIKILQRIDFLERFSCFLTLQMKNGHFLSFFQVKRSKYKNDLYSAHYKLRFWFFCHFGCMVFFILNFRYACLALLSKKSK